MSTHKCTYKKSMDYPDELKAEIMIKNCIKDDDTIIVIPDCMYDISSSKSLRKNQIEMQSSATSNNIYKCIKTMVGVVMVMTTAILIASSFFVDADLNSSSTRNPLSSVSSTSVVETTPAGSMSNNGDSDEPGPPNWQPTDEYFTITNCRDAATLLTGETLVVRQGQGTNRGDLEVTLLNRTAKQRTEHKDACLVGIKKGQTTIRLNDIEGCVHYKDLEWFVPISKLLKKSYY